MAGLLGITISLPGLDDTPPPSPTQDVSPPTQTLATTTTAVESSTQTTATSASSHKTSTAAKASLSKSTVASTSPAPSKSITLAAKLQSSTKTAQVSIANSDNTQTTNSITSTSDSSTSVSTTIPSTDSLGSILSLTRTDSPTTFSTSTSSLTSSTVSSTVIAPEPLASATSTTSAASSSPSSTSSDGSKLPVAGIVVASVMGFLALVGTIFILFRYCPPIRRRWELRQEQKRLARSYRSEIDDKGSSSEESSVHSLPKLNTFSNQRYYSNEPPTPAIRTPHAQSSGLGFGSRLSLLMQHSPFQTGDHADNVRRSQIGIAVSGSKYERALPALPR